MAVTSVSVAANPEVRLGSVLTVELLDKGTQEWVYILNEGAAALAAGEVVMRNTTSTEYRGVVTTAATLIPSVRCFGVAQHAITAGYYGFVLRRGLGTVKAGSGAAINDTEAITTGGTEAGSGLAIAHATIALACVVGVAVQNISAGGSGLAFIDCRG